MEEWAPEMVIVSYNGFLDLKEEDFNEIVKDLTVFGDHRIILFTNMSGMVHRHEHEMSDEI